MSEQGESRISRRGLLKASTLIGGAIALSACTNAAQTSPAQKPAAETKAATSQTSVSSASQAAAPAAQAGGRTINWKMQSTWAASDFTQNNAKDLATAIGEMSEGRIKIEVLPAGAIVPAGEVLDAVSKGLLDAGHSSPAYWYGKHPATALFVGVPAGPFGMTYEDFMGWMYEGGGIDLYNRLLQEELKLDVVTFPAVIVPPEPLGWFGKEIKTVDDFKGIKFRSAGMAAETFKEVGSSVVTLPGGEVVPALERKVIDAAEWQGPVADMSIGFQDVAKMYYMPSTHQIINSLEVLINRKKWEELSPGLKAIVRNAISANMTAFLFKLMKGNTEALEALTTKHGVTVVETPKDVQMEIIKAWDRVAERFARENAFFAKVLESQKQWAAKVVPYRRVAYPSFEMVADYYWAGKSPYQVKKSS